MNKHPKSGCRRGDRNASRFRLVMVTTLMAASIGLAFPLSRASAFKSSQAAQPVALRAARQLPLDLSYILQGNIIELKGNTASTAIVMVNGERIPTVLGDGSFT